MKKTLTHGSLFAGIGGFDLGFERAGIKTVWQVEIDPFCRKVLEKHFPHARRYNDIRECRDMPAVDVLAGGFPCQDISVAGKRVGIDGERSGLWREYHRLICELRPRFVVVENVAALLNRGMGRVIGDLAEAGYDAEWCCISAADLGAPHLRERIWIVAYPMRDGRNGGGCPQRNIFPAQRPTESAEQFWDRWFNRFGAVGEAVSDSMRELAEGNGIGWSSGLGWWEREPEEAVQDVRQGRWEETWIAESQPVLGRLAHGVPNRVERLTALGNSIVPQIAEWIGKRIIEAVAGESGRNPVESLSENEDHR